MEERHAPYTHVRRGWVGWVAVGVAVASAAAIWVLGALGELAGEPLIAAGIGVVGVLAVVFAFRRIGRSSRVHLADDGTLSLVFGPHEHTYSLTGDDTSIGLDMRGQPGDRAWSLDLVREGQTPLTLTAASVDPPLFVEAVRQWQPGL